MNHDVIGSHPAKDSAVGMWIALAVAVVLGIAVVCAGIRITYVLSLVTFGNYREPVLIGHGVTDSSDIDVLHLIATSRIYLFMSRWPDPLPTVPNPTLTATEPLPVPADSAEAAGYRVKAEAGDVVAASRLGRLYYIGKGVPMNFNEALKWFQLAASHGDAYSEEKLGEIYRDGYVVPAVDDSQALVWFRKAAAQGLPEAQDSLAWMYLYGEGVPKDDAEAQKWVAAALPGLRKQADSGDPEELSDLGDLYLYGLGVQPDDGQAMSFYQKAADEGDAYGQYNVGTMYEGGLGVPVSIPTALSWYKKSAAQGLPDAQIALVQLGK